MLSIPNHNNLLLRRQQVQARLSSSQADRLVVPHQKPLSAAMCLDLQDSDIKGVPTLQMHPPRNQRQWQRLLKQKLQNQPAHPCQSDREGLLCLGQPFLKLLGRFGTRMIHSCNLITLHA